MFDPQANLWGSFHPQTPGFRAPVYSIVLYNQSSHSRRSTTTAHVVCTDLGRR